MKKVRAIIERNNEGVYSIYMDDDTLTYGVSGQGETVEEAKEDFLSAYEEMKEYYNDEGKKFEEVEFVYETDVASFLQFYSKILSLAGLERVTGVSQGQLSHYLNGIKKPRPATVLKIENELHKFAKDLSQVKFVY